MTFIDKLAKLKKGKYAKKGSNVAAVATGQYDGPKQPSDKFKPKPKFNGRKQSFVSKVTGINLDSDPLSGEQKVEIAKAKYEYKKHKQSEKTRRAKWTSAGTAAASTGGSVAGSVAGANQQGAKTYEYNYFIDANGGTVNNMKKSKEDGTNNTETPGLTITYLPGGDR